MNNKNVVIFLCINFLAALFLLKDGTQSNLLVAQESTFSQSKDIFNKIKTIFKDETPIAQNNNEEQSTKNTQDIITETKTGDSCLMFGPLSTDNENLAQTLLAKNTQEYEIIDKPIYEIYWALGKDAKMAQSLYQRSLATGFIKPEKHKLEQDKTGFYFVSINKIDNSEQETSSLVTKIQQQANQVKTGGKWTYRKTHDLPYLKIQNASDLSNKTINNLKNNFSHLEQTCS